MSTLTLLRHGQAAFGASDYDQLSPLGQLQAQATGEFFRQRGMRFDRVWIGPRRRHRFTAQLALAEIGGMMPEVDEGLDEFGEGEQLLAGAERRTGTRVLSDGSLDAATRLRLYAEEIRLWAEGRIVVEGVAPAAQFRARVGHWLRRATADTSSGQKVLGVTSAGVIAAVLCEVAGLPDSALAHYIGVIGNASLTGVVFSGKGAGLAYFNGTGHLAEDLLSGI
ncbi:histidine phosphatase family protein [Actimicrobium sp. CCI2.3]|uniref:histidine phosphatase family protein n=1 Tax=Actimicrobium sp. CCI2.3 TaxID=3048616 RepID=UPI002AB40C6F|nr:histidine phosphatase family protein [Actimicrobium sp. CCI2.3]MDY7574641.1 histidine phosphatase family protein [Actimicrobium sp. CCI2.3]MEB0023993.1 histidine phosphatase family protein [Actimicrobium sp. CCI2.3]